MIRLVRHGMPPVRAEDEKLMFGIIRAAFNQRRKTLVNALGNAAELCLEKDSILCALEKMECAPTIRGEALTLEEFAVLAQLLYESLPIRRR